MRKLCSTFCIYLYFISYLYSGSCSTVQPDNLQEYIALNHLTPESRDYQSVETKKPHGKHTVRLSKNQQLVTNYC